MLVLPPTIVGMRETVGRRSGDGRPAPPGLVSRPGRGGLGGPEDMHFAYWACFRQRGVATETSRKQTWRPVALVGYEIELCLNPSGLRLWSKAAE